MKKEVNQMTIKLFNEPSKNIEIFMPGRIAKRQPKPKIGNTLAHHLAKDPCSSLKFLFNLCLSLRFIVHLGYYQIWIWDCLGRVPIYRDFRSIELQYEGGEYDNGYEFGLF